ncbi:TPA: uracil phosphoribosyltransferase [Legionella pneumophila]|uniref:Uracil phosphoribosyltransferase n=4 Tax=Legionella pneumophila TaxID=446 RepID=UPP_LEGPL|nr:uracil phosphoribosyltransferase [Legionella pneumophila]Q5WUK0.1 RecName: Full=Uracil phosphoribosyltransferase; AltName: Full=UMP pyrophosphorylase; AltName: Full=UPRTase [Legionella pneumophila str. Lens]Q5X340.1 RecName: Full=Uracil phosphoribosyltransferase; AltName: Full=UMP pyrophosphorylase; AltName: Full=UPRTase [Legionella pneumophila str. Paris]ERH43957.1 uracil phosphoribosyltransferase [Legionella pneumophila str. Leg01/11]ERH44868.1 uracil phosphoribosyltransferase [Legionella 
MDFNQVKVINHPLIQHKLTIMRKKETSTVKFRTLMHEVSMLLAYEVTRDLEIEYEEIETPLATMQSPVLKGKKLVFVSILRAGNGLLDGMLQLVPTARIGHIGLYRDPKTLEAVEYYFKLPEHTQDRDVIVVDPMLATGNSAIAAVKEVKALHPKSIKFLCLLAAPEGISNFHGEHPDVPIFTAAIDEQLNDHGYIVPGLGDAGDRLYGTKLAH